MIEGKCETEGKGLLWDGVFKVDGSPQVDRTMMLRTCETVCPFIFVGKRTYTSDGVAGVILKEVSGNQFAYWNARYLLQALRDISESPSGL